MDIFSTTILLFLIMDPLGNIPIFISVLKTVPEHRRSKVLMREMLIALLILVLFLFTGEQILATLHLKQESVSIAGAIILFMIAVKMIFPPGRGGGGIMGDTPDGEPFIVPLAIPMVAGPSILATLILLGHQHPQEQWQLLTAVLLAWTVSSAILLCSGRFMKLLGERGVFAIERLMGMILVMIAVQMFMDGIASYLS
ncbi:YhgN family NAAT transporter [Endozoicomonas sp. OPT23]|uniref:YhgN family NAAT transporter n=1 Tax=Endozoicomonas sp. OPT23 TaxID=2072845 RepID=UPI00351B2C6D